MKHCKVPQNRYLDGVLWNVIVQKHCFYVGVNMYEDVKRIHIILFTYIIAIVILVIINGIPSLVIVTILSSLFCEIVIDDCVLHGRCQKRPTRTSETSCGISSMPATSPTNLRRPGQQYSPISIISLILNPYDHGHCFYSSVTQLGDFFFTFDVQASCLALFLLIMFRYHVKCVFSTTTECHFNISQVLIVSPRGCCAKPFG